MSTDNRTDFSPPLVVWPTPHSDLILVMPAPGAAGSGRAAGNRRQVGRLIEAFPAARLEIEAAWSVVEARRGAHLEMRAAS